MLVTTIIALMLGVLTWSLLEYAIHRWLGHDKRTMPNFFASEHVRHHSEGNYFAPSYKKAMSTVLIVGLIVPPSIWVAGVAGGLAYTAGLVGFYLFYEVLHRLEHVNAGHTRYGRWARRHHFTHHFVSPKANHGVTSPIWDVVFRTYTPAPEVITVPERLAMPWLIDPATGDARAEHADRWTVRRAKRKQAA